ncbi:MAG: MerR family transcriptional regulator [Bacteroidaceae bacterium]|nr:MerR family transcriptional regulator [Bacteroidaceae bacterium]
MTTGKEKNHKLYYSIKEVAAELGVSESTLRYWESEFPQIAPKKGGNNVRQYTRSDIETIRTIHHLIKERGMTLAGARRYMKSGSNHDAARTSSEVVDRLKAIRQELIDIRSALDFL